MTTAETAARIPWTASARYAAAQLRRRAGAVYRALRPSRDEADWRRACRRSALVPRYAPGEVRLGPFVVEYTDLISTCPQWHDLFVRESLRFAASSPSPRVLDCGANIGLSSLYFKRLYPQARITAYEADAAIAAVCGRNLRRNGAADIEVIAAAVWIENGTVGFAHEGADSGAVVADEAGAATAAVPAVRLRDRLAAEPIDLLKLDIEGAEGTVLEDCRDVLGNVRAMLLDLHELDPRHRQTPRVLDLLAGAGFTYTVSNMTPLPWRSTAGRATPFAGEANVWACLVRAWRE